MNTTFIIGRYYRLRKDYPDFTSEQKYKIENSSMNYNYECNFEGRTTSWLKDKSVIRLNRKTKGYKVLNCKRNNTREPYITNIISYAVQFEGVMGGEWTYHPQDFEEVGSIETLENDYNELM
jgi:hypothetical protein